MFVTEIRTLTEREPVVDTFAHDLGRVDVFDSEVRFVLFTKQYDQEGGPPVYLVGRGHKIIMPKNVIVPAISRVLFALGTAATTELLTLSSRFH